MKTEIHYPDYPWSLIKSYNLTFDKTRVTKSARMIKEYHMDYKQLLDDDEILPNTSFPFVYFYTMMKYRPHFDYSILPRRRSHVIYLQQLQS